MVIDALPEDRMPGPEVGDTEFLLGREVAIKGRLGHIGLRNYLVDSGGAETPVDKKGAGRYQ